jgi:hypothetical protein
VWVQRATRRWNRWNGRAYPVLRVPFGSLLPSTMGFWGEELDGAELEVA